MPEDYIFLSENPLNKLRVIESEFLREFEKTLTPDEKDDVKKYVESLHWPVETHEQRQRRNLAVTCFIDGQRYLRVKENKVDPLYAEALLNVAIKEISAWSNIEPKAVQTILVKKVSEYVAENKKTKTGA